MGAKLNLTGVRFGRLVGVREVGKSDRGAYVWEFACDCGGVTQQIASRVNKGKVRSCGCLEAENRIRNVTKNKRGDEFVGRKFGRLTVKSIYVEKDKTRAVCECECGNEWNGVLSAIVNGYIASCGCYKSEATSARFTIHGETTKGSKGSFEYRVWHAMMRRCYDEKLQDYVYYGGRGIVVCERWHTFANFKTDMGCAPDESYTLDRVDVNGDYRPSNCRWATRKEQANNTRRTRTVTLLGLTMSISDWCECFNIPYSCVRSRLSAGWDAVEALATPMLRVTSRTKHV